MNPKASQSQSLASPTSSYASSGMTWAFGTDRLGITAGVLTESFLASREAGRYRGRPLTTSVKGGIEVLSLAQRWRARHLPV